MKYFFLATLFFFSVSSFGQGLQEKYSVDCKCWKITNHYDNGQVSARYIENKERKRDGKETAYTPDGRLQYERTWSKGVLHGTGAHYHQNGNVYYESHYENGQKTGTWTFMDAQGSTTQSIEYAGKGNDGVYTFYHAGHPYLQQTVEHGAMTNEKVINAELFDAVKAESAASGSK